MPQSRLALWGHAHLKNTLRSVNNSLGQITGFPKILKARQIG
jgi:hypothetical protein